MTNTFKNGIAENIGTSPVTVYTAPTSTTVVVLALSVANITTDTINISVELYDSSETASAFVVKDTPVSINSTIIAVGGEQKIILEEGDYLQVTTDTANGADVVISVMENS